MATIEGASEFYAPIADLPRRRLNEYSSREVAEELCLMDSELLRKIDPGELQNGAWMKKDKKYSLAPNIMAMVSSFNQLALLIPSEILDEETPNARAKVISNFIKVANKCHSFGNYNSLKAVLAGLQCTPIFRLKKTWKDVSSKKRKRFQYLCDRMSEDNNWQLYREEVDRRLQSQSPVIPFLGIFLTTVALSQEAEGLAVVASSRERLSSQKRRRDSLYENYVILEAVTVRKRLEKLRKRQSFDDPTTEGLSRRSSNPVHLSSNHDHTSTSAHSSILQDSDSDPGDLESVTSPIPKPFLSSKPLPVTLEEENEQDTERITIENKSCSRDEEVQLVMSPLAKDMRSNATSTPLPDHLEDEESEQAAEERTSIATPNILPNDEELSRDQSVKSSVTEDTLSSAHTNATATKPLPTHIDKIDEQSSSTAKEKRLTISLTKDEESSKLRSVRSPLPREDATPTPTSYVCTGGGMVFAYKRPVSSEIDGSVTENGHVTSVAMPAAVGKTKAEKPKKKLSTSNLVDGNIPSHFQQDHGTDSADQSDESNHVGGRFSPQRMVRGLKFTSKEGGKKKRITLANLRIRKKKLKENVLPTEPLDREEPGRKLSGSLECLIDAVSQDVCPDLDPFAGELTRSISLFNVSVELDENDEVDSFSGKGMHRAPSVTSDRSLQTDSRTSNESLQRVEEDLDSDDPPAVVRRLKHRSIHGFPDHQEPSASHPFDQTSESKKLEYRHSLKSIKEEKSSRFTHHVRNKSDTSMLPTFRSSSESKSPSITPKHSQNSSFNLFQTLQEHLKNTISMPNVFRRERSSKPVVSELSPPEMASDTDPITRLVQYQFLTLRCCVGIQSRPKLRKLLLSAHHNTEAQNYKLSFEREPN